MGEPMFIVFATRNGELALLKDIKRNIAGNFKTFKARGGTGRPEKIFAENAELEKRSRKIWEPFVEKISKDIEDFSKDMKTRLEDEKLGKKQPVPAPADTDPWYKGLKYGRNGYWRR